MAGVTCVKSVFHAGTGVGGGGSLTYNVYDMVLYTNDSSFRLCWTYMRLALSMSMGRLADLWRSPGDGWVVRCRTCVRASCVGTLLLTALCVMMW
jgi:hypothetical protein